MCELGWGPTQGRRGGGRLAFTSTTYHSHAMSKHKYPADYWGFCEVGFTRAGGMPACAQGLLTMLFLRLAALAHIAVTHGFGINIYLH